MTKNSHLWFARRQSKLTYHLKTHKVGLESVYWGSIKFVRGIRYKTKYANAHSSLFCRSYVIIRNLSYGIKLKTD